MWTVVTVYSALIFAGYWLTQPLEAWLIFWFLLMVHGLLWLQLVLVAVYGVWPGTLGKGLSPARVAPARGFVRWLTIM